MSHPDDLKVYVLLGFHTSFHHSWRGDTPDEAGFGTDIRVVRAILRILESAAQRGLQVRGYWDFDVYWTLQTILPQHAPDIIAGIRRRVETGVDEIVPGPYNNGANHAATEREMRTAIRYAFENPFGSGLRQVFGRVAPFFRPQESMYTAGQNAIFLEEGVTGLVLYYAGVPFNALSTFAPALPPEQRYNVLRLRSRPDEQPILLLPCISPPDLVDDVCLEALLLRLRRLQTTGQVDTDLLVHVNFDADGESWLPAPLPRAFSWVPNAGGLEEYIQVVNRYPWAEFTVPSEYVAGREPAGDLLVRQDLADGGFDGSYSWAEKCSSLRNWTALEGSRLHTYRAEALARGLPAEEAAALRRDLWEGEDSAFFRRLVGLTTTYYGMSTPVINDERQAKAERGLGAALQIANAAERRAARALRRNAAGIPGDCLYAFDIYAPEVEGRDDAVPARTIVRLPVILPRGVECLRLEDEHGEQVAASLINGGPLLDGRRPWDLVFLADLAPGEARSYRAWEAPQSEHAPTPLVLRNRWIDLRLAAKTGVASLTFQGRPVGDGGFLDPFITYRHRGRPERWPTTEYAFAWLGDESWQGLARATISTFIVMDTPHGRALTMLLYTFTLFDDLPYLVLDVEVYYARTPPEDTIDTLQQKLRRPLDLRWVEVAPCQLQPLLDAPAGQPLRVWKHNYLGVTSYYDLDYGQINPRNRDVDSFNHQATAGWVAVSDGRTGLLLAENADVLASMAFCPMRLREREGKQHLALNPFGSYHGAQLDYAHLGGTGVGAELTEGISGSLRPNGPSFNGEHLAFSLLLAPYDGDEPPADVQRDALASFYPPGIVYRQAPPGIEVVVPADVRARIRADGHLLELRRLGDTPLPSPEALMANPADGAVDLVWEPGRDARLTSYQVRWRPLARRGGPPEPKEWTSERVPAGRRWRVVGLDNGRRYILQLRAVGQDCHSPWTNAVEAVPGPVEAASLLGAVPAVSPWTLVRMVGHSLAHVIRARLSPSR
jgi:hypothetical protein